MRRIVTLTILAALFLVSDVSWARRDALTAEQKNQLERIDRVLIEVLALSDKGAVDPGPLVEVVANRMKEFGYTTVTDPAQPHDVELKIKCELRKTWEGSTTMGSDADLPDSPSRIWKDRPANLAIFSMARRWHGARKSGRNSTTRRLRPSSRRPRIRWPIRCPS